MARIPRIPYQVGGRSLANPLFVTAINGHVFNYCPTASTKVKFQFGNATLPGMNDVASRHNAQQIELDRSVPKTAKAFKYTAIPKHRSKIRVFELFAGNGDEIHGKMHTTELEDGVYPLRISGKRSAYEALSYTWHAQSLTKFILCDEKVLHITESLYDALASLRPLSGSRLLWIDQICINQADISERSVQVKLMRLIYNRAVFVIAWLGKEDVFTAAAFWLIDAFFEKHVSLDASFTARPEVIWDCHAMNTMDLPPFPSFEWESLAKFFEKDYFRRVWVVQEIVVASRIAIKCGSTTTRWEHVEYLARSLLATGWIRALKKVYGSNVVPNFVQTISNIGASFSEIKGGQGIPLSILLNACRSFRSTDPRDKVIALVGLADYRSLNSSASAMLDYTRSVVDIYIEVTGQTMKEERSLNLLSSVEDISDRTMNLPSWVPNYQIWQKHTILGSSIRVRHLNFHAAGTTPVALWWMPGSRTLNVDGFTHDEIRTVSESSLNHPGEDTHVILQWLQLAEPLIRRGCLSIESFWRTLIGDGGTRAFPAPEQYGIYYNSNPSQDELRAKQEYDDVKISNGEDNSLIKESTMGPRATHRRFFTTTGGLIGLGPRSIRSGDKICILSGGRVPYVLRKDGDRYRFVGESYVHGLMEGQAVEKSVVFSPFEIH